MLLKVHLVVKQKTQLEDAEDDCRIPQRTVSIEAAGSLRFRPSILSKQFQQSLSRLSF